MYAVGSYFKEGHLGVVEYLDQCGADLDGVNRVKHLLHLVLLGQFIYLNPYRWEILF